MKYDINFILFTYIYIYIYILIAKLQIAPFNFVKNSIQFFNFNFIQFCGTLNDNPVTEVNKRTELHKVESQLTELNEIKITKN